MLTKQLSEAMKILTEVVTDANEETDKKVVVNALVKRGSLFIQQCTRPKTTLEIHAIK